MSERVVSIKLVADATGLTQSFNRASDAAQDLKNKASGAGQSLADSARNNREAWATVGTGLTAVGVAITGVGVAALKTGIQYNTLQQTTRAALTTLLGSAQAANQQMDKLDAFARNSPFAKSTFITAQQQMLAFGIETQKVIPYLDAVQNAVAAAGGANADIEGIVATMSKIQSSSKITAQDLNEFGNRGVNAAELIGSQMGKTGAQIRADITSGSLDATTALDALAAGMSQQFDGAADNVKNTFAGAMDRVKAAWRDFAAELAKPLVDPNGGGALVDLLNWTADAMRAFEGLPAPVKDTATGLTGLVGAGALAGGAFMLLFPKALELNGHLKTLGVTTGMLGKSLGAAGLVLVAGMAMSALVDWSDKMRGVTANANDLADALKKTGDISAELDAGLTGGHALRGIGADAAISEGNLRTLNTTVGQLKASFDNTVIGKAMSVSLLGFGREAGNTKKQIEELDAAMAAAVSSGDTENAAEAYDYLSAKLDKAGYSTEEITEALPEYTAAQRDAAPVTKTSADLAEDAASAYMEQANAAKAATDELFKLVDALMESNNVAQTAEGANARYQKTLADVADYIAKAQEGVEGYSISLDRNTVEGSKNREMFASVAAESQTSAAAIYEHELTTLGSTEATANYTAALQLGRDQLYDQILALTGNSEAARILTDDIYGIPDDHTTRILAETAAARNAVASFIDSYDGKTITIYGQMAFKDGQNPSALLRANGGTIGYAGGGTIESAANGRTIGGIGGGVASGTVFGAGTSKSDSILVRLSKGEEVVQEPYASQNRGLLKAINRGDFHQGMMQPQVVVVPQAGGSSAPAFQSGDRLVIEIEGTPLTGTVKRVLSREADPGRLVSVFGT